MRSKMLGLAIALSTFGLGVAATTLWIAYRMPEVQRLESLRVERGVDLGTLSWPREDTGINSAGQTEQAKTPDRAIRCEWSSRKNAIIDAGVLNGRGIPGETPAPVYPAIAEAAQASGIVVVQVLADECGSVISARAVSGNPLLQQSAVQAAYRWHLAPGLLGGEPVKVRGTLTFNYFVL